MVGPHKSESQQYAKDRKKIIGTFNEEDLYHFFKDKLIKTAKNSGLGGTANFSEVAREAWKKIPLSTLEGLITAYKIRIANLATIEKANRELKKDTEKEKNQSDTKKCDGNCSYCRRKEQHIKKADKDKEDTKKNDGDGKEKKPCGPDKGCGKKDGKKDPPNCSKKKKDAKGKCKDNDGKCGEKKGCGNCAESKATPRCGGKKDCGKCPDKKDGGKCSKKKDEGNSSKKKDGGKCSDQEDAEDVEMPVSSLKRRRLQSDNRVANKRARRSSCSSAGSSSSSASSSSSSGYSSEESESS